MTGETGTVKKGFFIPTWLIAAAALALIAATAVQFGGNSAPIADQSGTGGGSGSGDSNPGGSGNVATIELQNFSISGVNLEVRQGGSAGEPNIVYISDYPATGGKFATKVAVMIDKNKINEIKTLKIRNVVLNDFQFSEKENGYNYAIKASISTGSNGHIKIDSLGLQAKSYDTIAKGDYAATIQNGIASGIKWEETTKTLPYISVKGLSNPPNSKDISYVNLLITVTS